MNSFFTKNDRDGKQQIDRLCSITSSDVDKLKNMKKK
jgi:hypothetical protein